jgi:hypothetical protein
LTVWRDVQARGSVDRTASQRVMVHFDDELRRPTQLIASIAPDPKISEKLKFD